MATSVKSTNRSNVSGKDTSIIAGIKKDIPANTTLPLGGQTYTPTSLVAFIQSRIDAAAAAAVARANWLSASQAYKTINGQASVVVRELRSLVTGMFGAGSPKLADFGFAATTRAPQTVEQKAAAAAKRTATRKARGTLGRKQKRAITGTVTPAPATPVASVPAATPASVVTAPVAVGPAPAPTASTAIAAPAVTTSAAVGHAAPDLSTKSPS